MTLKDHTYRIPGGKVGILLIHGLCGTPTEMRYVANGLGRAGYTVLCPQLAGHCGSEADLKAATWQEWYASCEVGLAELRKTCDVVMVGGLSTGALLSLAIAANNPDTVDGLVLLAPVLWLNGWLIPWYARLFRTVFSKRIANLIKFPDLHPHGIKDARIREFIINSLAGLPSTPGGAVLEHRWLADEVRRLVPGIQQPALIIHPREDDYADLNNAWYLQRKLPGMVDMVVLDDSYHIVTVDRQRDVVVERTVGFVERLVQQIAKGRRPAKAKAPVAQAARQARTAPSLQPIAA
jgi:carboxylesterase